MYLASPLFHNFPSVNLPKIPSQIIPFRGLLVSLQVIEVINSHDNPIQYLIQL